MNKLQQAAFDEGAEFVKSAFRDATEIGSPAVTSLINACFSGGDKTVRRHQEHERDANENLVGSTSYEITAAESAGFQILGAFTQVEVIRKVLVKSGVSLTF